MGKFDVQEEGLVELVAAIQRMSRRQRLPSWAGLAKEQLNIGGSTGNPQPKMGPQALDFCDATVSVPTGIAINLGVVNLNAAIKYELSSQMPCGAELKFNGGSPSGCPAVTAGGSLSFGIRYSPFKIKAEGGLSARVKCGLDIGPFFIGVDLRGTMTGYIYMCNIWQIFYLNYPDVYLGGTMTARSSAGIGLANGWVSVTLDEKFRFGKRNDNYKKEITVTASAGARFLFFTKSYTKQWYHSGGSVC